MRRAEKRREEKRREQKWGEEKCWSSWVPVLVSRGHCGSCSAVLYELQWSWAAVIVYESLFAILDAALMTDIAIIGFASFIPPCERSQARKHSRLSEHLPHLSLLLTHTSSVYCMCFSVCWTFPAPLCTFNSVYNERRNRKVRYRKREKEERDSVRET